MSTKKIDSSTSLAAFLTLVIEEGVKSALSQKALTEKEKQAALAPGSSDDEESSGGNVDDLFGGSGDSAGEGEDNSDDAGPSSKTMDDESEKLKRGEIKVRDVVDKLNSIRSGKSFKDDAVSKAMDEYINSLSRPEKVALLAFLKGIAQIVTGEVPGQQAEDPSDNPSDVKMQKGDGPEKTIHKKPNVIKGGGNSGHSQQKGPPEEDTSAPAPITPKRR